eukprot:350500-Chlamydomonas_euryale.AAC.13
MPFAFCDPVGRTMYDFSSTPSGNIIHPVGDIPGFLMARLLVVHGPKSVGRSSAVVRRWCRRSQHVQISPRISLFASPTCGSKTLLHAPGPMPATLTAY